MTRLAAAWEAVAARRAARGVALRWASFAWLPDRQVVACRTLAALVAEFPDRDPVVLARASEAAWRVIDDPTAATPAPQGDDDLVMLPHRDEDEDEDVTEARAEFTAEVTAQWTELARELLAEPLVVPPALTHTLSVLAKVCEEDASLTPMDHGLRESLVTALRQAATELARLQTAAALGTGR